MKKITLVLALVLIASMFACAFAQVVYPMDHEPIEPLENGSFNVSIYAEDVTETEVTFDIFFDDFFDSEKIDALAPGDVLVAGGFEYTVRTVEEKPDGTKLINGGFEDSEDGITLSPEGGEYLSKEWDDRIGATYAGTVTVPFADEVTFSHYECDEAGNPTGGYIETKMPGSEVKNFIKDMGDAQYYLIDYAATFITVLDGKVDTIMLSYVP